MSNIELRAFYGYLLSSMQYSRATASTYIYVLRSYKKLFNGKELDEAKEEDCINFFSLKSQAGQTAKTIAKDMAAFNAYFNFLILEGVRKDNPMARLERPKRERTLPAVLSIEEINTLLNTVPEDSPNNIRDRALFELMYSSGLRVSEIIDIKMEDIFFDECLLKVRGKGAKERIVPFGKIAKQKLIDYLDERNKLLSVKHPRNTTTSGYLFLNKFGSCMTRQGVWKRIKKLSSMCGIYTKLHTLRHSYASHLLKGGADLRSVQCLLGHSSITTTEVYTHIKSDELMEYHKKYLDDAWEEEVEE